VQQLQEKHHNGRASSPTQQCMPTLTSIPSPPDQVQQLQEKHHNGRTSSPTQQPTPTSNTSSSGEDFPQQHRQLSITSSNQNGANNPFHILPPQRVHNLSGSFFPSPCSSPYNSKSPGPTHITDNDDPRCAPFPANNDLPLSPPLSGRSISSNTLAHILNTREYSPLQRCDDGSHRLKRKRNDTRAVVEETAEVEIASS
jgi:hypothetical protein